MEEKVYKLICRWPSDYHELYKQRHEISNIYGLNGFVRTQKLLEEAETIRHMRVFSDRYRKLWSLLATLIIHNPTIDATQSTYEDIKERNKAIENRFYDFF